MKKVLIYIEEYENQLMAFRSRDDRFMGQGSTVKALFERLAEDVRNGDNIAFIVEKERGAELLMQRVMAEHPGELHGTD